MDKYTVKEVDIKFVTMTIQELDEKETQLIKRIDKLQSRLDNIIIEKERRRGMFDKQ
jgi:hypothetical protein